MNAPLPAHDDRQGIFGPGSLDELPRIVGDLGLRRILMVTGRHSFAASGGADVLPRVREVAQVETWSDFSPNPEVTDVINGIRVVDEFAPDGIVAIGGGSALDVAKLLAVFAGTSPEDLPDAVRANAVEGRSLTLILVPTTSGSGSEATHFAVTYIGQEKYSVAHPALLPDYVVLDPVATESASPYQKATSVIDAIAQAVESHWARGASQVSRAFAHDALSELVESAPGFHAGDSGAAVGAARGSHLAGRAIDLSKTTGAHAMAYGLTKGYGVSHGHAVATTLGAFARHHAAAASEPGANAELGRDLDDIAELVGAAGPAEVGDRLDAIAAGLGLELRLSQLGVPRSALAGMARAVNHQRLANNPVALDERELHRLLETCW